ncbi:hypothetical protein [Frigoribacterium sp. SL97]|uniref:hypothetical protein n=1 Tax=Frigoribacterium sp. SL97 TaxID=2994664 RepID=UPI00226DAACC|nr:hypothetical protein [Frigoribacterium sp. SL97]WAC50451.1 hypothetical protein OVA02_11275 [Frigoribacterium sp. SL97]
MTKTIDSSPDLTPGQARALVELVAITAAGDTATGWLMARRLWPDSPAWNRRTRGRRTGTVAGAMGGTMPMLGAKPLWALEELGLAMQARDRQWVATSAGKARAKAGA